MKLALFDFDNTLTTKDSLPQFIKFAVGKPKYYLGLLLLSPNLVAYVLKILNNNRAKEKLLSYFFKGWPVSKFEEIAKQFSLNEIDKIINPAAINKLKWHKDQGHRVIIVSASINSWLRHWCIKNNIELISTALEIKNKQLTGKYKSENCHGIEKVNRLKKQLDFNQFSDIYAYGDSSGDYEMLKIATKKFFREF